MTKFPQIFLLAGVLAIVSFANVPGTGRLSTGEIQQSASKKAPAGQTVPTETPKIQFIELGSVNCIPCRQMQPVMKSIEAKYSPQVKVIFYDVWTPEQSKYARLYSIRVIPTQVFLDGSGKEIFRHQGFFPQKDLEQFLAKQGVKPTQSK
jgi:thioredoxin 1